VSNRAKQFRPRWSMKSSFMTAVALLIGVTVIVLLSVHRSIWTELEIVTAGVALLMFAFLTVVLHHGVRFDKNERFSVAWPNTSPLEMLDASSFVPDFDSFIDFGSDAGPLGIILGILVSVVGSVVLTVIISVVLWIGVNAVWAVVIAVSLPLFYFYRRILRSIVVKGRACRGNWSRAAGHACLSTILYTAWFYVIFVLAHHIDKMRPS